MRKHTMIGISALGLAALVAAVSLSPSNVNGGSVRNSAVFANDMSIAQGGPAFNNLGSGLAPLGDGLAPRDGSYSGEGRAWYPMGST